MLLEVLVRPKYIKPLYNERLPLECGQNFWLYTHTCDPLIGLIFVRNQEDM